MLATYYAIPRWPARKQLLLLASYLFYAAWSVPYVLLLVFTTLVDWCLARSIGRTDAPKGRRALLVASLVSNLGMLAYFKYAAFLIDILNPLLAMLGTDYQAAPSGIVLPLAISFYTFASLSYTIDVYRRQVRPDASLGDYALFVTFFPHLIAGPIVRAAYLLPQIEAPKLPSREDFGWGLTLLVFGLFAKVTLADGFLAGFVDSVYAAPAKFGAAETWAAVFGFAAQIYLDFAGYSLCAIGLALTFGFSFPDNFHFPYGAIGFSDFWRRWHISLSTWLRDYLYIPLGGKHGGWLTYRNLMLTMLIGGLWHGASWMFVAWGGLHGVYLVFERFTRNSVWNNSKYFPDVAKMIVTFVIVAVTWIPFRSATPADAVAVVKGLTGAAVYQGFGAEAMLVMMVAILVAAANMRLRSRTLREIYDSTATMGRVLVLSACLFGLLLAPSSNSRAFIYFQF
ncbi:MAG: MBOAT family O-acyltransferase [Betaproteobacteria bacterium]